jgi:hypothetical protein
MLAEIERHRRRRPRFLAQIFHHLPAGMIELQPELRALCPTDPRPIAKCLELAWVLENHPAGSGHGAAVDHDIAGQDQAGATVGPRPIELKECGRGGVLGVGHVFLHRGLGDAVGNDGSIGKCEGFERRHGTSRLTARPF